MESLPSTEFRKRFARLTKPTVVTVNRHAIGTWIPIETGWLGPRAEQALAQPGPAIADRVAFNSRPFTPVPKGK